MVKLKDKKISKVFENLDVSNLPVEVEQADIVDNESYENEVKNQKLKCQSSHTEAVINWATIANKITVPNIVKGVMTLEGAGIGSLAASGLGTGLGFAMGGPTGAVLGYKFGNYLGLAAGFAGGYEFGKIVGNKLQDEKRENIVEKGVTEVNIDTTTKVDMER